MGWDARSIACQKMSPATLVRNAYLPMDKEEEEKIHRGE